MTRHRGAHRKQNTTNREAPIRRVPSSTSKKGCDTDDAAARTSPRVSPGTRREVGGGYHRHPPGRNGGTRRCHRVGAKASRDFSRIPTPTAQPNGTDPPKPSPITMRQRSNAATHAASLRTPPRGQEDRREAHHDGSSNIDAEREGTTSTAVVREARASGTVAVAVRTQQRGMPGHPWPSQARSGPVKPRRPQCSRPASSPPSPSHASHLPRLPEATPEPSPPPARPGPDGTRRAQIWAERTTTDPATAAPRRQRRRRRPVARLHAPRSPAAPPDRRHLDAPSGAAPPVPETDREGKGQEAAATSSPRAKPAAGAGDGGEVEEGRGEPGGRRPDARPAYPYEFRSMSLNMPVVWLHTQRALLIVCV
nr:atherin-like [Aegilops tauschii subsp. strangulata]